jgi:hypothetical protein
MKTFEWEFKLKVDGEVAYDVRGLSYGYDPSMVLWVLADSLTNRWYGRDEEPDESF